MSRNIVLYYIQPVHISDEDWIECISKLGTTNLHKNKHEKNEYWAELNKHFCSRSNDSDDWKVKLFKSLTTYSLDLFFYRNKTGVDGELFKDSFVLAANEMQQQEKYLQIQNVKDISCNLILVNKTTFMFLIRAELYFESNSQMRCLGRIKNVVESFRYILENKNSVWSKNTNDLLMFNLKDFLSKVLKIKTEELSAFIELHTGHILTHIEDKYPSNIQDEVNELHCIEEDSEEVLSEFKFTKGDKNTFAHFGWSNTTIVNIPTDKLYLCIQMILYMQHCWFFLRSFKEYLVQTMVTLSDETTKDIFDKKSKMIDSLTMIFHLLNVKHSQYKSIIKPWQSESFTYIEHYWKLNQSFELMESSLNVNKNFLEKRVAQATQKIQQKQSTILFIITLLQTLTIVSFFNDYFGLISNYNQPFTFISPEKIRKFNVFLPILLLVVNFSLVLSIYGNKLIPSFRKGKKQ